MTSTLTPTNPHPHTTTSDTPDSSDPVHPIASSVPASRSTADVAKALPTTLKAEWIKLSSIRSNSAIVALTLTVGAFVSWAVGTYVTDAGELTITNVFTFAAVFTAVFAAVGGILLFSSEAQHGTLAPSLTAQPARWVLALAKMVIAASFGAVVGALGLAAGMAGAAVAGLPMGTTTGLASTIAWATAFTSLAAVLGLGVGMIARHSTAAVSGLLVWWLVVENLLTLFLAERFSRFLPFVAGNSLTTTGEAGPPVEVTEFTLTTTQNALVFGGYTAAALLIGTVLLYRRDN